MLMTCVGRLQAGRGIRLFACCCEGPPWRCSTGAWSYGCVRGGYGNSMASSDGAEQILEECQSQGLRATRRLVLPAAKRRTNDITFAQKSRKSHSPSRVSIVLSDGLHVLIYPQSCAPVPISIPDVVLGVFVVLRHGRIRGQGRRITFSLNGVLLSIP